MRGTLPLASLLVVVAAHAGETAPPAPAAPAGKPGCCQVDANSDGIVTRAEAKSFPRLAEQFDTADTNKDGQLDAAEMAQHRDMMRTEMRAKAEERWKVADQDGDGAVSRSEAEASMPGMAQRFEKFDADGDGKIERAEMHAFRMRKHHGQP